MVALNELNVLREYFNSGATRSYEFRKTKLQQLKSLILSHEEEIYAAVKKDLNKSCEETWASEIGLVIREIDYTLRHLKKWMQPRKVTTNLINFPSSSCIIPEPLGVVLIISPWNYPLMLLLKPLAGAIAAGNCSVLKSSEHAPATTELLKKMMKAFDSRYILFTEGDGAQIVPEMMNNFVFDHVFFTGSTIVGKAVYQLAAKNLVPVTLELGGKSPCVILPDADIKVAAKRIVLGKFTNSGQICIAPDYLLVHHSVKDKLITALKETIRRFYTDHPEEVYHYGRIINERQFDRILQYLQEGKVVYGGRHDRSRLFIEPTLLDQVSADSRIMKEEIFGPLLPVIGFDREEEALKIIAQNPNPLAFYLFTNNKQQEDYWMEKVAFGGGCINNALWHIANEHLSFGGRGQSGFGRYQGKQSFDTFSHHKSVLKTPNWFDPSFKYPPFKGKLNFLKKFI